jgi:hypothetical protein
MMAEQAFENMALRAVLLRMFCRDIKRKLTKHKECVITYGKMQVEVVQEGEWYEARFDGVVKARMRFTDENSAITTTALLLTVYSFAVLEGKQSVDDYLREREEKSKYVV